MTRVSGRSLAAAEIGERHAREIGRAHLLVHGMEPAVRRPPSHPGVHAARAELVADVRANALSADSDHSDVVIRAWRAAGSWIAGADVERLLSSGRLRFSRGDPNLSNYMWGDDGAVLIDWENSGLNDLALELADMAEHASTRDLSESFWDDLAEATQFTQEDRARS
jgi:hypothetical protein